MSDPQEVTGATIVFVDALADAYFEQHPDSLPFLGSLASRRQIEPGLGFSVNIKAELLAGMTPDDVGFFCKWSYSDDPEWRLPRWAKTLGGLFDGTQFGSRVAHRLLSRAVGLDLFTIPFDEIDLFEPVRVPEAYLEGFPHETMLSRHGFKRVSHDRSLPTDAAVGAEALRAMTDAEDNVYVALIEPDAVGHRQGPSSQAMADKLRDVDSLVGEIYEAHLRSGRGLFVVFSDHGMADVVTKPWFDPKEVLGSPGPDSYAFFSDSTMLRFWFFDDGLRARAEDALRDLVWGGSLSPDERSRFGVASDAHGDLIFLADEGVIPRPSYVGGKHPRAIGMHGYHPDLPSQFGVVLWEGGAGTEAPERVQARDFPRLWSRLAGVAP